jgi:molybdate transport system ATP-binding protein
MPEFISFNNVVPLIPNSPFHQPINWQINTGELWAVIGNNGCGKSMLSKVILGQYAINSGFIEYHFLGNEKHENRLDILTKLERYIHIINLDAIYSFADLRETYYQQRYNSSETDSIPYVSDLFHPDDYESAILEQITKIFSLEHLMDRRLIHLSSGELRKLIIAKVVMHNPRMMIFDNPFIGLDVISRDKLNDIFLDLNQLGIQLIFLIPSIKDLPEYTTHILEIQDGEAIPRGRVVDYLAGKSTIQKIEQAVINWKKIPNSSYSSFETVVKMDNVEISYKDRIICKGINWTIKNGEKWALVGPNGSGKSTLLSFIFADNPIAYTKNLTLFDLKRGSGESIWEIKQRIGFTSSEMHLYYRQQISSLEVIISGFFDSIGLYHKCTEQQKFIAQYLMNVLSINRLSNHSFMSLSSGEQRIVLFLRTLVKNPDLLILDEPFHGLDADFKFLCRNIVESFCLQYNKTLIYVTHSPEEIPDCVDKVFKLN